MRDALGRGVRAVRRAERVIHVRVEAVRERPRERGIVRLLFRMEPDVLEHEDVAWLERTDLLGDLRPDAVVREWHPYAEQLRGALGHRPQAQLPVRALRPAEM